MTAPRAPSARREGRSEAATARWVGMPECWVSGAGGAGGASKLKHPARDPVSQNIVRCFRAHATYPPQTPVAGAIEFVAPEAPAPPLRVRNAPVLQRAGTFAEGDERSCSCGGPGVPWRPRESKLARESGQSGTLSGVSSGHGLQICPDLICTLILLCTLLVRIPRRQEAIGASSFGHFRGLTTLSAHREHAARLSAFFTTRTSADIAIA